MDTNPGDHHAPMRKGTHSCVECRRRKIRCLYSQDDQTSCITCRKKNTVCQEQRREHFPPVGGKKMSLKDRVAKLEALLKSSAIEIEEDSLEVDLNLTQSDALATHERNSDPVSRESVPLSRQGDRSASYQPEGFRSQSTDAPSDEEYDPDPLISLFNNRVWRSQGPKGNLKIIDTYQSNIDQRVAVKRSHVLALLRSGVISAYLLRDILNATSGWWQSWHVRAPNLGTLTDLIIRRPLGPWPIEYTTAANYTTLQDFLLFAYNSEIPAVVGLAVLCIAECLRKLFMPTHEALISQLPRPPQELFQILLERVDRLINTDGDFSNTKAGIDCLMMSGKLYQGLGLPKRSWLSFHKAIVYAEFHGLHRFLPQPGESKEDCQIRRNAWDNLCQTDLFISMTLGLPYAASGRNIPPSYFGEPGTLLWFQKQVMDAAAQLIDRNQSGLMNDEIPTRAITDLLDVAASKMHPEFWNGPQLLRQATSNRRQAIESTTKQMFYWLIRLFNHLPFSIQSIEQPQLEGHRFACQAGCRGMLTIYNVMRSDKILDAANLIDYQAFISSSILLLGLLGYGNSPTSYTQIDHDADRDLVSMTLQVLHETSNTGNNTVAAEAVEGLESLFMLTDPAAHHAAREMDLKELKTRIKIPYIGTIYIAPGEQLQRTHPATPESFPALPCFTFSHPEMTGSPFQPYQVPDLIPPNCVPNPLSQIPSGGPQDMMNTEFTSIDFEFDTLMAMNPWDWSWITAEIQPEQYQ